MSSLGPNEAEFARTIDRIAANDPTITYVDFNGWEIGDEGARRLVEALEGNTAVRYLRLTKNGISAALVSALVGVLENSTTLRELDLEGNSFGVEGARALARFIRNNSSLARLLMRYCGIGADGVRLLAEALPSNSTLTELDLKNNNIGDVGASLLAELLPGNSSLVSLLLDGNGISDVGVILLAEALPSNTSLAGLYLVDNDISDAGARALAEALLVNSSVAYLQLKWNGISEELEQKAEELVQINDDAPSPQEALGLKIEWLIDLDEDGAQLLGFDAGGAKEKAVSLALDNLDSFVEVRQRRELFRRLLGSSQHGENVAKSVDVTTARALYQYAADCGAAPTVLLNLLRAYNSLCTCRDVRHHVYPFMLLATMPEAGAGDVMELLLMNPSLVESGISGPNEC